MNKYQSKLHREIRSFIAHDFYGIKPYKAIRKFAKRKIKDQWETPCGDCDNMWCTHKLDKIFYCQDNR